MINKEHFDSFDCIKENLKLELAEGCQKNRASEHDSVEEQKHQQMIN